jgi:hypothetical protein
MIPMRRSFRFSTVHVIILAVVEINSSGSFSFFLGIRLLLATIHTSMDNLDFLSYIQRDYFVNNFLYPPSVLGTTCTSITTPREASGTKSQGDPSAQENRGPFFRRISIRIALRRSEPLFSGFQTSLKLPLTNEGI